MPDKSISTKMRFVNITTPDDARRLMEEIGVDREGIRWMVNKAVFKVVRVENIRNRAANILKQEMLSLGAEAAVPRAIMELKDGYCDVLLMGTLKQYNLLAGKLKKQPFGLAQLGKQLEGILKPGDNLKLKCGPRILNLSKKVHLMGILNVTPDSFSDGGKYDHFDLAIEHARQMADEGADIIDVGGESSRPGAEPVSWQEERQRVIPLIKKLAKIVKVPLSIDTYKSRVAEEALDNGAVIVNDISALRLDRKMAKVVASRGVPVILMHMQGLPRNMQDKPKYKNVTGEIIDFLAERIAFGQEAGISISNIVIDPGIGFGKTTEHNLKIICQLKEFKVLGTPVLVGPSRKKFIGNILDLPVEEREEGTLSSCVMAMVNGANILRVHEVGKTLRGLKIAEAIQRG
jgi:dihydropteroate synthase